MAWKWIWASARWVSNIRLYKMTARSAVWMFCHSLILCFCLVSADIQNTHFGTFSPTVSPSTPLPCFSNKKLQLFMRDHSTHKRSCFQSYNPTPASWYTIHNTLSHKITRESLYGWCIPSHTHAHTQSMWWNVFMWFMVAASDSECLISEHISINQAQLHIQSDWLWTWVLLSCIKLHIGLTSSAT